MANISFYRDLENFLPQIPIFSSIPKSHICEITHFFEYKFFVKDTIIFNKGDNGDVMYIIQSGSVSIYNGDRFIKELNRGDFFGEMAILTEGKRNANARVSLDAHLYCLKKKEFDRVLEKNKSIGLFLSRQYARRLEGHKKGRKKENQSVLYTASATDKNLGLSHFLYSMCYHIATESAKKVLIVEPHHEVAGIMGKMDLKKIPCPDTGLLGLLPENIYRGEDFHWFVHDSGFIVLQVNKGFSKHLKASLLPLLEGFKINYDLVFLSLSHSLNTIDDQLIRLCDKNLLLINNTDQALARVKKRLAQIEKKAGPGFDRVRVGVSHLKGTKGLPRAVLKDYLNLAETPQIWVDRSDKAFKNKIDTQKRFPIRGARALAREIAGIRIGLVLGAGAARGWAHIGVLKVLEEQGIPIDMIAGTSMGALVGAIYAVRASVDHLKKYTIDLFSDKRSARKKIFDYTLPFKGLFRGEKAMDLVRTATSDADFMDLLIPSYIVGVDILKGEEILMETGSVSKAVRASLSIPAVFAPYKHMGRWMVDGGLLNPVPVDVLSRKGANKIIAVCVETQNIMDKPKKSPGILNVIFNTINIVHSRATRGFSENSDMVIYPDVAGIAWDDFHKGQKLMKKGENACRQRIDEIRQMVSIGI